MLLWVYIKRLLSLILVIILAPIVLVFIPPIFFSYIVLETRCCFRRHSSLQWYKILILGIFVIIAFTFGIAVDVIFVPLAIVIGIPGFIIYYFYSVHETKKRARKKLKERMK